ncbi:conserved hypothetical protein [Paraburkholderia piptadeniae]|uniref:KTSC domain-containing protein n=1 Tax=Paraburkholderia piptadeniae TaxID=1701573 RepID=A0A1N7RJH6_9BURK|nr:conserved hypothetical protein [Paraburkholderia piptadeniae]
MPRYRDVSGRSGVVAYETSPNAILVGFKDGKVYLYDYATPGWQDVEKMKRLAVRGRGLSTYISQVVRDRYAKRLR